MHTISTSENETVLFILPVSLNNINNYNVNNQNCLSRFNFMGHKIDLKHISCSSSSLLDVHTNICLVQLSKLAIVRRRKCLDLTQLSFPVVTMKSSLLFILGVCCLISVLYKPQLEKSTMYCQLSPLILSPVLASTAVHLARPACHTMDNYARNSIATFSHQTRSMLHCILCVDFTTALSN